MLGSGPRVYLFLAVVLIVSAFPFYWSFLIGSGDAFTVRDPNRSWIPGPNFLTNVQAVFDNPAVAFLKALRNSLIVSGTVTAAVVFFSTLAGFAFAKLRFRGSKVMLAFVVATMAIPWQLGMVPLFIMMSWLGWTGSLLAVIVPNIASAFGVYWMAQYIGQALPDEVIESTRIDGASSLQAFWHVVLPIARPAAAMLGLLVFIGTWTDFFWPFLVLNSNDPTLPVALQLLQSNYFVDYSIVLAGALLATAPLLILFALAGRQLVAGIMEGAVKG
jgi:cellobiose transport system permease protein